MTPEQIHDIDHALHDFLSSTVRRQGPQELAWLARRARRERRDARITEDTVAAMVDRSTLLVWHLDGRVRHLRDVMDGIVLTHRARANLEGREDLWLDASCQPLLNLLAEEPLPLASGGFVRRATSGHEALLGPAGWLPPVRRFELVGLRLLDGTLRVEAVAETDLPDLVEQQRVRALIADHYKRERWWSGNEDLESRPAELVGALTLARMEVPDLLSTPYPPLAELLHNPLEQDLDEHFWRDLGATQQLESVSFWLEGMPAALDMELTARARLYGMSMSQFVIALLGHLAWRTPFAEDCGPWEHWDPQQAARVVPLRPAEDPD